MMEIDRIDHLVGQNMNKYIFMTKNKIYGKFNFLINNITLIALNHL
jgi:hypothetical protein